MSFCPSKNSVPFACFCSILSNRCHYAWRNKNHEEPIHFNKSSLNEPNQEAVFLKENCRDMQRYSYINLHIGDVHCRWLMADLFIYSSHCTSQCRSMSRSAHVLPRILRGLTHRPRSVIQAPSFVFGAQQIASCCPSWSSACTRL